MTDEMPERIYCGRVRNDKIKCFEAEQSDETLYIRADLAQKTVTREELANLAKAAYMSWVRHHPENQSAHLAIAEAIIAAGFVRAKE